MTQPIRVWVVPPGPNPWKPIFILEELGLPYEVKAITFQDVKKPPMTDVNPNGRVPAIEDPNTGLTLWESGAILTYLVEQYDKDNRISFDTLIEKNHVNQYLHFQVSGQGPYYGPAGWFRWLHPEKLPSAIDRYTDQTRRVLGVLEGLLEKQGDWLVGGKMTIADMAFVPWNDRVDTCLGCAPEDKFNGFPRVQAWHERMISLPSWKRSMEKRAVLMDEQGLMWNGLPKGTTSLQDFEEKVKSGEIK